MSDEQLLGIMEQLILLSAFLGGFSATFLAAILAVNPAKDIKIANWIIIASAFAACCFIVCAVSSISVVNGINASSINEQTISESVKSIRLTSVLSALLGVFSLLASIGLSGWLRDKRTGMVTTSMAAVAIIIVGVLA